IEDGDVSGLRHVRGAEQNRSCRNKSPNTHISASDVWKIHLCGTFCGSLIILAPAPRVSFRRLTSFGARDDAGSTVIMEGCTRASIRMRRAKTWPLGEAKELRNS